MCNLKDHFKNEDEVVFNLLTEQITEFEANVLAILNLNKLFELETKRMDKVVNSIIADYGFLFSKVIIGINKLIKYEKYEMCKELYDRMNYLFRHIFIIELKIEDINDDVDIETMNEQFNDLFKSISNHINNLKS